MKLEDELMKILKFEGTAEEFQTVSHLFAAENSAPAGQQKKADHAGETDDSDEFRTAAIVKRVLTRHSLTSNHRKLLSAAVTAGEKGLTPEEWAIKIGISPEVFKGVLGSFGRRASQTPGWPDGVHFFDWEYDDDAGQYRYWIPKAFLVTVGDCLIL